MTTGHDPDPALVDPRIQADLDDDLVAELRSWQEEFGAQVYLDRWLDGGYTEARVGTIVVNFFRGSAHKYVLKACPAGSRGTTEGNAHARALASGPEPFVRDHLVEQPFPPRMTPTGGLLMFQQIAGGDMGSFRPLSSLYDSSDLPNLAGQIAAALLADWAPDARVKPMSLRDCVRTQLGRRCDSDGALERWAQEIGSARDAVWLRFEPKGRSTPNPIHWLQGAEDPDDDQLLILHGRAHGDLHLDNVFVEFAPQPQANTFRLIDLSEWDDHAPLCRDIPHLLLATIGRHLGGVPTKTRRLLAARILAAAEGRPPLARTLQTQGLELLTDTLLAAGDSWAAERDMPDDWRTQLMLGVVAAALIQATVSVHPLESRWWFFELASAGLARLLGVDDALSANRAAVLTGPSAGRDADAAAIAERLDEALDGFSGRKATVLLIGEGGLSSQAVVARQPWDLVLEFDPATDSTGAYAHRDTEREHRLFTFGQQPSFGLHSTVWLAADGLLGGQVGPSELRAWRRECLPGIQRAVASLARSTSRPVCVCAAGNLGGKSRAVVEALLDVFTTRAELLTVSEVSAPNLVDYGPQVLEGNPADVLGALPDRAAPHQGTRDLVLPGLHGPVPLVADDLAWLSQTGEVLHSDVGRTADHGATIAEGFFRGGTISWLELDVAAEVPRGQTPAVLKQVRSDLAERGTWRISLHHYPGAGGTTVARRVAWDLRLDHPVVTAERLVDPAALADRVRKLHALTELSVLVVVEATLHAVIDWAYSALRAESVPCVFLIVERRADDPGPTGGERSFYIGGLRTPEERGEFVETFGRRVPDKHPALTRLAASPTASLVPFLFGLTTYEADYVGLPSYVERSLDQISAEEREAIKFIALTHHYAGLALPAVLLAGALRVPDDRYVDLRALTSAEMLALLVEDYVDEWRTSHDLVAAEILRQVLMPAESALRSRDAWKVSLSTLSIRLIEQAAKEYGDVLPDDVRTIIEQLFIVRNNTSLPTGERDTFSELTTDIPAAEGRIEVLRTLAESFPHESHFWAHFGRILSYEAKDHPKALEAIDRAISLELEDDTFFHMKGMILRNLMKSEMENRERVSPVVLRERVLSVVQDAREQFDRSIELNDVSEYGYVALAQLCIRAIEFGRRQTKAETYGAFFSAPDAGYYRELLSTAEESLERIREIRGGDRPSRYSGAVEAEIQAFYDDYAALLQGWRNLLDRADIPKAPIRRQLVRAYLRRAGTWRHAAAEERARAMTLLEESLRDNPADIGSLREWLMVGRFGGVSLDRAAELIGYSSAESAVAPRDVLYYDYVVAALLALGGRESAINDYRRTVDRSRERATAFGNRRFMYEWYTEGTGLRQLVHHSDLRDWERSAGGPDPPLLRRVEGRVHQIRRAQAGEIEFGPGLRAFFTPAVASLVADRHTNSRVSFLLGFTYEGPQAWSVRLVDARAGGSRAPNSS